MTAAKKKAAPKRKAAKPRARKPVTETAKKKNPGFVFPAGNKYWQCRAKHGRNGIWATPDALMDDCLGYFEWLDANPLQEQKGFAFQGVVTKESFNKMRAATLDGLQLHLGISHTTWANYREKPDFVAVIEYVEKAIRHQKFTGAAADLLNANIIARDLGLADKQEHAGEISFNSLTDQQLDEKIAAFLNKKG